MTHHVQASPRKTLSAPGLLREVRRCFQAIGDDKAGRGLTLTDCLMSGLGRSFRRVFHLLQRGKGLEEFLWWGGHYLLSVDGTGYFYSDNVYCEQCCEKHHRDGRASYYHQLLGAVLVHPARRVVLLLAPEPIVRADGTSKNYCERTAAKRLLADVRRDHPHLKLIVVQDSLAANGPHIELLQSLKLRFILGVKPGGHTFLFDWVGTTPGVQTAEITGQDGTVHRFRYLNGAPLNDTHFELEVNFLDYEEQRRNGTRQHFTWVTDIPLHEANLLQVMRGAGGRWKIENETFNTLKNQGYHLEHNFGHGYQHLSMVYASVMKLAFLVDQV